jgi:HK97 family phage major capsid protein
MTRTEFQNAVVPLEHILEEAGWTESTKEHAATHLLSRRLSDQAELRLRRVDEICDDASTDVPPRDLRASEKRECERLQDEVRAFQDVNDELAQIMSNPARARRLHLRNSPAPTRGFHAGPPEDPLSLTIARSLAAEVNDAVRNGLPIRRSLADARAFGQVDSLPAPELRNRLVNYAVVTTSMSPQAAFVALRPVAPASVVAEGGAKPEIANAVTVAVAHAKVSGFVDVTTEELAYGSDMVSAVQAIAFQQLVAGENVQVVAALAGGTAVVAGTSAALSILAGIAQVASGGAQADVIAINPADVVAVLGQAASGGGYVINQGGGAETLPGTLWGVPVVAVAAVPAGSARVWASNALGVSVAMPPSILVDPYSQAKNNITNIIVEELIAVGLTQPTQAAVVDLVP